MKCEFISLSLSLTVGGFCLKYLRIDQNRGNFTDLTLLYKSFDAALMSNKELFSRGRKKNDVLEFLYVSAQATVMYKLKINENPISKICQKIQTAEKRGNVSFFHYMELLLISLNIKIKTPKRW